MSSLSLAGRALVGLDDGETFAQAAKRELREETGCSFELGPCVWFRRHQHSWNNRPFDQYERFFVAHTQSTALRPEQQDGYIIGHKWWSIKELRGSDEIFAPRAVANHLPAILNGTYPETPIDCGV